MYAGYACTCCSVAATYGNLPNAEVTHIQLFFGVLLSVSGGRSRLGYVAGLEGSEDNPILIDLDNVSLSEEETEICTSLENFNGSLENPIWILDEATVYSLLLDPVGTPKGNMEDPQSENESRLCESPESDWQGVIPAGSPRILAVNSICIPEGSVEVEP
ncbi:uncharacterized protein P174DRAFT_427692 [Aspergillus novofumigatus IBT 16806]|uniref:Uncharacterized protein n=1 Tax=Aspergillus novofumigatus (strain IBT 16806) TaxID=1392255 RepID=A0A2I1CPG0_ASPN1|nr:uncharacterized protein P174DRAFT_427692 [Aspergillus novofumigatus IBT 16806]PKX99514.1 hypothetical protein P174DRAFT_427692 [Aspergillus novofumigatus IBT 16806]